MKVSRLLDSAEKLKKKQVELKFKYTGIVKTAQSLEELMELIENCAINGMSLTRFQIDSTQFRATFFSHSQCKSVTQVSICLNASKDVIFCKIYTWISEGMMPISLAWSQGIWLASAIRTPLSVSARFSVCCYGNLEEFWHSSESLYRGGNLLVSVASDGKNWIGIFEKIEFCFEWQWKAFENESALMSGLISSSEAHKMIWLPQLIRLPIALKHGRQLTEREIVYAFGYRIIQ
jgi:hypothetical protein